MSRRKTSTEKTEAKPRRRTGSALTIVNPNAAGIDVGAASHFVAVPEGRDEQSVREFENFTEDLNALADWLTQCAVDTVAMESTGVYWIPLHELLETRGFKVLLVNARHVKHVSGRKTDVSDCQWLQQLHTYGLLSGAFRPADSICALRVIVRQRSMLVADAARRIQQMQKALAQMNLQLANVVSDISGVTGLGIIRAIVAGERDPNTLAQLRDKRCAANEQTIAKSLVGNYREEHLFALGQAVALFDFYQHMIQTCDAKLEAMLPALEARVDLDQKPLPPATNPKSYKRSQPHFDLRRLLYRVVGVDLTRITGIEAGSALRLITEIGIDMSRWPTSKHFSSWLGLCPGNKISGGKVLSSKTKKVANRAAATLRLAANTLTHSKTALGAYFRRMCARMGRPQAITATAHKLARIVYHLLRYGEDFVDPGQAYYEQQYRDRVLKNIRKRARQMGFELVPKTPSPLNVNPL